MRDVLGTQPNIIEDLELGAVSALPPWPETVRIVRGYCELLRLDPEPLLWRIQQLLRGDDTQPSTRPAGPPPPMLRKERARAPAPRRVSRGRGIRKLLFLSLPPILAGGLLYLASSVPAPFYRTLALLPPSLAELARAGLDALVLYSAPRENGLRWIDIGDPGLRKVDKLPTKAR